jgi:hypothetical protein
MLNPIINITISQKTPFVLNGVTNIRDATFKINFVNEAVIESSWVNLTDTCKLKFPKNIYLRNSKTNEIINWENQAIINMSDINGGNTASKVPIFMRGDVVQVEIGYIFPSANNSDWVIEKNMVFEGYITKVNPRVPLEISCEDEMWQMKQMHLKDQLITAANVEQMLKTMTAGYKTPLNNGLDYLVNTDNFQTTIGDYRVVNATLSQVLNELREKYYLQSYFRRNTTGYFNGVYNAANIGRMELRCGLIKYYSDDRSGDINNYQKIFHFQKNVFSNDNLVFTRLDDIRIGVKAYSIDVQEELSQTNKDGSKVKSHNRIEATVGDTDGEMRTLYFYNVDKNDKLTEADYNYGHSTFYATYIPTHTAADTKIIQQLATLHAMATQSLKYLKYEGYRGNFTTFGYPRVKHGDICWLQNEIIPDLNGKYFAKSVKTSFGVGGIEQEIGIDYRIDQLNAQELEEKKNYGGV